MISSVRPRLPSAAQKASRNRLAVASRHIEAALQITEPHHAALGEAHLLAAHLAGDLAAPLVAQVIDDGGDGGKDIELGGLGARAT